MKTPKEITVCNLEVVVMPQGEVICLGNKVGWVKDLGEFLTKKNPDLLEACKKAVGWLKDCEGQVITHNHGVPYDHIRIAEEELKQAIAKAEEGV